MNNGYKVPVLTEGLDLQAEARKTQSNQNRMLNILNRLNESEDIAPETTPEEATKVCPQCGVEYVGDKCPQCGKVIEECEDPKDMTESFKRGKRRRLHENEETGVTPEEIKDPEVAEEKPTNESDDAGVTPDEVKDPEVAEETKVNESTRYRLTRVLTEYYRLCENEEFDKAKELKEEEDVDIKIDADGNYEIKEADEEDETQKVVLTEEDLEGIEKVEESISFGKKSKKMNESTGARKKKSTKARARRQLSESYRKTRIMNAVQKLAMQEGISFSSKKLQRAINEAYRINEAEIELPEEKAETALEKAFNDAGVTVKDCDTEVNDGVLTAHLTLEDTDAEVFLGDVADEVEDVLDGFDVDYDEPEINEDEEGEVYVDFHFVPVITSEATEEVEDEPSITEGEDEDDLEECDDEPKKVTESRKIRGKRLHESEDEEVCPKCGKNPCICENDEEDEDTIKVNEDDDEDEKDVFESFAGGMKNVRCKINPAFIKPGQVIFDSDSRTVFKAMTESAATKKGFGLSIDVFNSANSRLARLTEGAEVTLSTTGKYYLLRENPVK